MKRMRSIILAISLSIVACAIALWIRSYWRLDVLSRVNDDGSTRAAVSYQGAWHFVRTGTYGRQRPMKRDAYHVPAGSSYATLHRVGSVQWQYLGFARVETTPTILVSMPGGTNRLIRVAVPSGGTALLPYGPSDISPLVPWLEGTPYLAIIVPYWAIALVIGVYPIDRFRRVLRGAIRRHRGCCVACGYDLRGTPARCPECGDAVTP